MMRFWWQPIGLYIYLPSTIYFISVYHFSSLTRTRDRLVLYTTILSLYSTVLSFFFFLALGYLLSNKSVFFFWRTTHAASTLK